MIDEPRADGRRRHHVGFAVVAFILAFLLATAWSQQAARTKQAEGRRRELATLVAARQQRALSLEKELSSLRAQAERLRAGSGGGSLARAQREIDRLALFAGTTAVHGGGLVVTLTDSPLARTSEEDSPDFLIQDVDLQLVVNELWAAGAEAVAINGQRLIATSAIRTAGQTVLVNYKVLSSPYRVEAIGDPDTLLERFDATEIAERFRNWSSVYGLGFEIKPEKSLDLPAFRGGLSFRYARPKEAP